MLSIYLRDGLKIGNATKPTTAATATTATTLEPLSYWSRVAPLGLPALEVPSSKCMHQSQKAQHELQLIVAANMVRQILALQTINNAPRGLVWKMI